MTDTDLATMDLMQLRTALAAAQRELQLRQVLIDKLTHENAWLKRLKFAASSEAYSGEQRSLFDETLDMDLAAVGLEIEQLAAPTQAAEGEKRQAKRLPLPAHLPRELIHHEPSQTVCACGTAMKRIGEDVAEKLDYQPGVFTVQRHIRGKWACVCCERLVQAPVPAQVIDKGLPTAGLLAHVLIAKYQDHLPLYRQQTVFERAGHALSRSTLAQWVGECGVQLQPLVDALKAEVLTQNVLHADETPVAMLKPGLKKTHKAYLWTYSTTVWSPVQAVIFQFAQTRGGQHVREFLGLDTTDGTGAGWQGHLVCDDFSGYKACFERGVSEAGCMAHARRKFYDLWANHGSPIGQRALTYIQKLYDVEQQVRALDDKDRLALRRRRSRRYAALMHRWMIEQRKQVPDGSATAKALDYSLNRWAALTRFVDDAAVPIDNNHVENKIRPIALGRKNWLFAGSLRSGQRAAAIMSLIHSASANGHDPYRYLRDVLQRLPTHPAHRISELLPHRWVLSDA